MRIPLLLTVLALGTATNTEADRALHTYVPNDFEYAGNEYLTIRPLKKNNIKLSFNFETNHTTQLYPSSETAHYGEFPKTVGSILESTHTREMHLRFDQGWYDANLWGKLMRGGKENGGTGVELWAAIEAPTWDDAFEDWLQLANTLSGLFCASLNFIDSSSTTSPVTLFQPNKASLANVTLQNGLFLFRSALPREPICTENMTPFLKMLPTKGKAGIASLLTGKRVFNSEWSSMAIDAETICSSEEDCHLQLRQSIDLVKNIPRTLERNEMPIPKPISGDDLRCDPTKRMDAFHCFPLIESNVLNFRLQDLFGRVIHGGALMASKPSQVCTDFGSGWNVTIDSLAPIKKQDCYMLDTNMDYDLHFSTDDSSVIPPLEPAVIHASRSMSGYSQDTGGFRLDLFNPTDEDQHVVVFETLPWFVRAYMHTLTLSINDTLSYDTTNEAMQDTLNEIIYSPAADRKSPTHLELMTFLPAHTKVKLSFDFDKAMLLYAEYPPDANHGFEIEPAVIAILDPVSKEPVYQMRTTTALLTLPTPDFSMPYNVIILTSTVMSMAFGSFFNMLTKRTVTEEDAEKIASQSPLARARRKIQAFKAKLKGEAQDKS